MQLRNIIKIPFKLYIFKEDKDMAYVINDDCINCGACVPGCPVNAISEGEDKMVIDADLCVDCGACAGVCPVGAPNAE